MPALPVRFPTSVCIMHVAGCVSLSDACCGNTCIRQRNECTFVFVCVCVCMCVCVRWELCVLCVGKGADTRERASKNKMNRRSVRAHTQVNTHTHTIEICIKSPCLARHVVLGRVYPNEIKTRILGFLVSGGRPKRGGSKCRVLSCETGR